MTFLPLTNDQQTHFSEAVYLILTHWFVLKTAVEQGWGGKHSDTKAMNFIEDVIQFIVFHSSSSKFSYFQIQDYIEECMNMDFCTLLEDDSSVLLAKTLYQLYVDCQQNNFTTVQHLRLKYGSNPEGLKVNLDLCSSSSDDEEDDLDDSDSDETMDQEKEEENEKEETKEYYMDLDEFHQHHQSIASSSSSSSSSHLNSNIDEDGFILVTKGGKGKKKPEK